MKLEDMCIWYNKRVTESEFCYEKCNNKCSGVDKECLCYVPIKYAIEKIEKK